MAGTIKGISVSIGGDTVDLKKSLKDVEQTSKSLQSELNAVNKQLKFDPSNSVLLAQKQEILEEKISATKETLKKLEAVQGQVEEQAKKGDLGADKYRAYQREVEATKGVLNNLEKQLDETKNAQSDFGKEVNKTDLSNFKKEVEDVKSSASELKDTLKETATGIGAGLAVAGGAATAAIMSYNSVEDALNHLQAQTGMSSDEMNKFKGAMENVYNGNYGEDMKDIANVMASVAQFTGETDPDKIQKITENVFALSDTFGYDYAESLRTLKMLTDQFGLSSDEAFNLIAQGTQKGLNKNGDLLDTINEYSVHYKQLGYTAEEFFNSLENGSSAGTFSVDKLGDAMKEFGIRSKDTATTTTEGFELIGLDADKMREAFAKGGDSAKEATEKTLDALFNLKDEVKQNQAGVDLFGTMWEDLGIDGVKALMNVTGEADKTKKSMQEIQDVKYDDLGNRLETLGRKTQTEVINPLIEKFFPVFEDGVDWAADHLDDLIPIIKALGKQVAIVWGVKKATEITKGVMKLISSYKTLATATKTATDGQKGLNAAQKANVIGLVVGAVLSLISAIDSYNETQWENSDLKKEIDKTKELTDEWNDLADSMSSKIKEINDTELDMKVNFEDVEKMKERLQEIIKDGTIDENEKGEYTTIVDLLKEKVDGFETNWNNLTLEEIDGNIVIKDNITEVSENLDDLIKKWELTQTKMTMSEMYNSLKTESAKKEVETEALKDEATNSDKSLDEFIKYVKENSHFDDNMAKIVAEELVKANGDVEKAGKSIAEITGISEPAMSKYLLYGFTDYKAEDRIKEYTGSINDYNKSIKNGETQLSKMKDKTDDLYGSLKILSGGQGTYNDYIKLSTEYGLSHEAVLDLIKDKSIKTWSDLEKVARKQTDEERKNLEEQRNNYREKNDLQNIFENSYNNSSDRIVFKSKDTVDKSNSEFDKLNPSENFSGELDETQQSIEGKTPGLVGAMSNTATQTQNAAKIGGWSGVAFGWIGELIGGIFGKNGEMENAGQTSAENAKTGAGKVSLFSTGVSRVASFISGLFSDKNDPETAGEKVAGKAKTGSGKVSLFSIGNNLVSGFINGILSGEAFKRIDSAAMTVAKNAHDTIKNWLGIQSPSKETKKLGKYFSDGFAIGISENAKKATNAAETLANNAQKKLNTVNLSNTLENINGMRKIGAKSAENYSSMKTVNNSPTVVANVYLQGTAVRSETDLDLLATKVSDKLGEMIVDKGMEWG